MSWLVSVVLAGMMFASESSLPIQTNSNYIETNTKQIVRLDETERFEQTYPLTATGRISVSNVNGSITIEAWDRNEVKLVAVKTADTREHLADVQINIGSRPDSLSVETDYDALRRRSNGQNRNYGRLEVQYHLTVPRNAVLNEIEAVNGSVIVSNMTNVTRVSAVNGEVRATNLRGTANLETVNGTIEADFSSLQPGSQISLSTVNGRANLLIPSDANATIKAETTNGSIANDFGLPVRKGQYVGRDLYGRVGNGDVKIQLESVNGALAVRRKQDGRTVNPAINLLQPGAATSKSDNNFDFDFDYDAEEKVKNKIKTKNKATAKTAVKPMVVVEPMMVEIPKIYIDTQKAIENAHREIAKARVHINTDEMNAKIKEGLEKQQEAFARMRESGWFAGSPSIEKKSNSFAVKGIPKVTIDAKNCSVSVRGWDKPEVQYVLTKFSRNPKQSALEAKVDHTDSQVNIKINSSNDLPGNDEIFNGLSRVRVEVFVPKKSNLRIHTNGEIRLENVSGDIDLQGADEAVNVRDVDGNLRVGTVDGRIRLIGFRGDFDGKTNDGMMNLEGDFESFSARSSEGTIVLTVPENANAYFNANTEIESDGLDLIRENENSNSWRLGKGGTTYKMNVSDGKVIVRCAGLMKTVWQ